MSELPPSTHNGGPDLVEVDPIDAATDPFSDFIEEASNWADGSLVENDEQLKAVDVIIAGLRPAESAIDKARLLHTKPQRDWIATENARWKITTDDIAKLKKCLVNCSSGYRKKLADKKAAEERAAWEAANKARREAEEAERKANAASIDDQRAAEAAKQAAIDAEKAAKAVAKEKPKGLRWEYPHEITDMSDVLRWMNKNARADLEAAAAAFVAKYVREHKDATAIPGVVVTKTQESF